MRKSCANHNLHNVAVAQENNGCICCHGECFEMEPCVGVDFSNNGNNAAERRECCLKKDRHCFRQDNDARAQIGSIVALIAN